MINASNIITVQLSPLEYQLAQLVAERRNDKPSHTSRKFSEHSDFHTHLIGACGELGFARLVGLPVDTERLLAGDDMDFQVSDCTIEVKTRVPTEKTPEPDLMCRPSHAKSDLYILAWWRPENHLSVSIVGWCSYARLTAKKRRFTQGERYIVEWRKLGEISKMIQRVDGWKMNQEVMGV